MITAGRLSSLESMLAGDHDRLDGAFQAIVTRVGGGDFQQIESEWLAFQGALLRHLDAEEKHLIPALAKDRPREAQILLDEHTQIRVQLLQLGADLDVQCLQVERATAFVDVLRAHARREENIYYPWTDRPPDR
jgi:hemerythrin-like domain-containing protein